jgi:hypothetical protein
VNSWQFTRRSEETLKEPLQKPLQWDKKQRRIISSLNRSGLAATSQSALLITLAGDLGAGSVSALLCPKMRAGSRAKREAMPQALLRFILGQGNGR